MLELTVRHDDENPVLVLAGELDMGAAEQVEQALVDLERQNPSKVVADLSGLTFIDSSGLRILLRAHQRAEKEGRTFLLIPGPEPVQRVFRITRLEERLQFLS